MSGFLVGEVSDESQVGLMGDTYIKNCTHTCSLPDKTPYEMVHGKKPNLRDAYEWGKDVYVKIKQDDKLAS